MWTRRRSGGGFSVLSTRHQIRLLPFGETRARVLSQDTFPRILSPAPKIKRIFNPQLHSNERLHAKVVYTTHAKVGNTIHTVERATTPYYINDTAVYWVSCDILQPPPRSTPK